jgi:DNA-binding NtrC family response regulator
VETVEMDKLLIVDDDIAFLNAMLKYLGNEYEVLVADNPATGIALFQAERPSTTIVDVSMPGMNGIELLRVLRRYREDARIVIVSGNNDKEICWKSLRLGAVDYLHKPVSIERLCEAIERASEPGTRQPMFHLRR